MIYFLPFFIFCIDQITKVLALCYLKSPISIIDRFFTLTLVFNPGSIWGLGQDCTYILAILGILAVIFIFWYLKTVPYHRWMPWFAILAGGIAGNTFDRLFRGHVIDFLDFQLKNHHWPCFNIADIAITLACCWLLFTHKQS